MRALRRVYDRMPPRIDIPEELQSRRVEVVFLELDDDTQTRGTAGAWPAGLFERTAGAWQGAPLERTDQGDFEHRLELE